MKKILLFCTEAWLYLIEIPLIVLLVISCIYTGRVEAKTRIFMIPIGLIPLIVIVSAAIIFIFLFFLRFISFSFSEVKCKGPFSSHDRAFIDSGKKLIFTLKKSGRVVVELFGNDGMPPMYDGADEPIDIYLFRGSIAGGRRALSRVLRFYGVSKADLSKIVKEDGRFSSEYEFIQLESYVQEDIRVVTLTFTQTV